VTGMRKSAKGLDAATGEAETGRRCAFGPQARLPTRRRRPWAARCCVDPLILSAIVRLFSTRHGEGRQHEDAAHDWKSHTFSAACPARRLCRAAILLACSPLDLCVCHGSCNASERLAGMLEINARMAGNECLVHLAGASLGARLADMERVADRALEHADV